MKADSNSFSSLGDCRIEDTHLKVAKETIKIEIDALQYGMDRLGSSFSSVVRLINSKSDFGKVVVSGVGKSGHIGNKIAATLASTGTLAHFVHPAEAGHGDLGMLSDSDVFIALSQSGESEEVLRLIPFLKRKAIPIVSFTGNNISTLAKYSDFVISTAVREEACPLGLAPTASTTLAVAIGDALAMALLRSKGFTAKDFAETHPLGALGRKLFVQVDEVMSSIDESPVVHVDVTVKDALFVVSKFGLGFTIVVEDEEPVGVFTDGDLRRCLDSDCDIKSTPISTVMTKSFSKISANALAVEAVQIMEDNKVSGLPVVSENGFVAGAVNMRQLLNAGII